MNRSATSSTARPSRTSASDQTRIQYLYDLFFQRPPSDTEIKAGADFIASFQAWEQRAGTGPLPVREARAVERLKAPEREVAHAGRARVEAAERLSRRRACRLTGWQEYAHALLLTNEASFVN